VLSVVIPIRGGSANAYLVDRLAANLTLFSRHDDVECVVVDSASPRAWAERIRRACDRPRCRLVIDPGPQHPFAPGQTRNVGGDAARGDYLLFYDVDLVCGPGFVPAVTRWIASGPEPADFLMIPCLYLHEEATRRVSFTGAPVDLTPFFASLLAGENHLVDNLAVSTSTIVVARAHFERLGGNRPDYRGHGCEDFDLLHRLASYRPDGRRPADYYLDFRTRFPGDYRGFRAYLARYALPRLFEGLYTAHLWHPRPVTRRYFRQRRRNEALLQDFMRRHDRGEAPLPDPWRGEGTEPAPPLRDFIDSLMRAHGYDPATHPGLLRWKDGLSPPRGATRSKLRKLLLRPREFFADSRLPVLRSLSRLFPP
jgi:predicted glycosyltransferase involved in capsule biosynthesis